MQMTCSICTLVVQPIDECNLNTVCHLFFLFPNILLFLFYWKYPKNMTDIPQTVMMFILTLIIGCCVRNGTCDFQCDG